MSGDKTSKNYFADYGYKSPDESVARTERAEYKFIEKWIDRNSKVLCDVANGLSAGKCFKISFKDRQKSDRQFS
ncbi:MAG: hypothetical protein HY776_05515 [Actinobacteria bacterium]|nr:hypothetical protein [Actinomycetota bacterium]